jgi:hypothetical protein
MIEVLNSSTANVIVKDHEGKIIVNQANLYVKRGRKFIREVLNQSFSVDNSKYVVELGTSAQKPTELDEDIVSPFLDPDQICIPVDSIDLVGDTEIDFNFSYTNNSTNSLYFSEMGLFYRPTGLDPDVGPDDRANIGYLLARLRTTYSNIIISHNREISIIWKIIF